MALKDRFRRALHRPSSLPSSPINGGSKDATPTAVSPTTRTGENSPAWATPTGDNTPTTRPPVPGTTTANINDAGIEANRDWNQGLPNITLTKTTSKLGLSKTLTWKSGKSGKNKKQEKDRKALENWSKQDALAWDESCTKYPNKKSKAHQDLLRAFEWKFKDSRKSFDTKRSGSVWSGYSAISPGTSRMGSLDEKGLERVFSTGQDGSRKRSAGTGIEGRDGSGSGSVEGAGGVKHTTGLRAEVRTVTEE